MRAILVVLFAAVLTAISTAAQAQTANPCELAAQRTRGMDIAMLMSLSKKTAWQPAGGEVLVELKGVNAPLTAGNLTTCLRWATISGGEPWRPAYRNSRVVKVGSGKGEPDVELGVEVPSDPPKDQGDIIRRFMFIPQMEVMVILGGDPANPTAVQIRRFGVVNAGWGVAAAALVLVFLLGVVLTVTGTPRNPSQALLKLISTKDGRASLSQFQVMIWLGITGTAAAYVLALSGDLIPISEKTLALLGISGAALLGAQVAPGPTANPPADGTPRTPHWRDLLSSEDGQIDVTRLQMLFFSIITAVFVAVRAFSSYAIPDIDNSYLMLMGIANGVYFLNKYASRP